jgi:hypothetical protein
MKRSHGALSCRCALLCVALFGVQLSTIAVAEDGGSDSKPWCNDGTWPEGGFRTWSRSAAAIDLYNAGLWVAGTAAVNFGTGPPNDSRWSEKNSFDDNIRDGLKLGSSSERSRARTASDVFFISGVMAPIGLGLWGSWRDCDEMADIATDWAESMTLTALLTESAKVILGRKRPCRGPECREEDNRKSYFSGHASMSAAGAGLVCSQSIDRELWGESALARVAPCAMGIAWSLTTGLLRIAGDKHWATDVLTGWAVGALVGYFDVPGPFDLLRFEIQGEHGEIAAEGMVLPYAGPDGIGARLSVRF